MKYIKHPEFNYIEQTLFTFLKRLHMFNQEKFMKEVFPHLHTNKSWSSIEKFVNETKG